MNKKIGIKSCIFMSVIIFFMLQAWSFGEAQIEYLDLKSDDRGAQAVYELIHYGIIDDSRAYFSPEAPISKEEFEEMLMNIFMFGKDDLDQIIYRDDSYKISLSEMAEIVLIYLGYEEESRAYGNNQGYRILSESKGLIDEFEYNVNGSATRLQAAGLFSKLLDIEFDNSDGFVSSTLRKRLEDQEIYDVEKYNPNMKIVFVDENFDTLIREKYGFKSMIRWKDIHNIRKLELVADYEKPVRNLEDLKWFTSLKDFKLLYENKNRPIEEFEVTLTDLSNSKILESFTYIHEDAKFDLQQFWSIPGLKVLDLGGAHVRGDVTALKNAKDIEELVISGNITGSVEDIIKIDSLRRLHLGSPYLVGKLWIIGSLDQLEDLSLSLSYVEGNLELFRDLKNLKHLYLSDFSGEAGKIDGNIVSIADLDLETLGFVSLPIFGDVKSLENMRSLKYFRDSNTDIVGNLSDMTVRDMENLSLEASKIVGSIEHLKYARNIETINLDYSNVTGDIASLSDCTNLDEVKIKNSKVYGKLLLSNGKEIISPNVPLKLKEIASSYEANRIVEFKDPQLEAYIRQDNNLQNEEILWSDIINQETIDLSNVEINSINDLIWFRNLKRFRMGQSVFGKECDLSVFSELNKLEHINLDRSWVLGDLAVFKDLTHLKSLNLKATYIAGDLELLNKLGNLEELNILVSTGIRGDFDDVAVFKKLKIYQSNEAVTGDLSSLSGLTKMEKLEIFPWATSYRTEPGGVLSITGGLADLKGMKNLKNLTLYSRNLSSPLSDLKAFKHIETIDLHGKNMTGDISELKSLLKLRSVKIAAQNITGNVKSLSSLSNLLVLEIHSDLIEGNNEKLPNVSEFIINQYYR